MAKKPFKNLPDNVTQLLIEHEYRLLVLETVLDWIIAENWDASINLPTTELIDSIKQKSVNRLREEYPEFGIKLRDDILENNHEG